MDILQYSALKEQSDLITCVSTQQPALLSSIGSQSSSIQQNNWWKWKERIGLYVCPAMWYCGIPTAPLSVNTAVGASNSLRVCNTAAQFNCGQCCLWTVPSGASCMRIQLWGAGAGTNSGCCCGGSPFGTTGAYASIIMPAVPSNQYTLCAGCAVCCWEQRSGTALCGNASYAAGIGLCNFCAVGGVNNLYYWITCIGTCTGYKLTSASCQSSGSCLCNGCYDYCFSSCGTNGVIPFLYSYNSYYGTPCGLSANSIIAGVNGIYRTYCSDGNHYVNQTHPPIYGFDTLSQCNVYYTSSTCNACVYSAQAGFLQIPGAGGWTSHLMAGCNSACGDMGRMGMVCVTWW